MTDGTPERLTATEAKAGITPHVTRAGALQAIALSAPILFIAG